MVSKNMKWYVYKSLNNFYHFLVRIFQRALDDLKKKLLHQWDFVTMQAESQFR
jgi:hypothetical protein